MSVGIVKEEKKGRELGIRQTMSAEAIPLTSPTSFKSETSLAPNSFFSFPPSHHRMHCSTSASPSPEVSRILHQERV